MGTESNAIHMLVLVRTCVDYCHHDSDSETPRLRPAVIAGVRKTIVVLHTVAIRLESARNKLLKGEMVHSNWPYLFCLASNEIAVR